MAPTRAPSATVAPSAAAPVVRAVRAPVARPVRAVGASGIHLESGGQLAREGGVRVLERVAVADVEPDVQLLQRRRGGEDVVVPEVVGVVECSRSSRAGLLPERGRVAADCAEQAWTEGGDVERAVA